MPVVNQPYIGFEGPIGAGKTTLAQLLAVHLGATLILEDVDGNEFLPDFYANRERWALGMQLTFLISRYEQFRRLEAGRSFRITPKPKIPFLRGRFYMTARWSYTKGLASAWMRVFAVPTSRCTWTQGMTFSWIEFGSAIGPTKFRLT